MITNDIKRLKKKLDILEEESCNAVLFDLIDLVKTRDLRFQNDSEKIELIEDLKFMYKEKLSSLTPNDYKQQKLFEK